MTLEHCSKSKFRGPTEDFIDDDGVNNDGGGDDDDDGGGEDDDGDGDDGDGDDDNDDENGNDADCDDDDGGMTTMMMGMAMMLSDLSLRASSSIHRGSVVSLLLSADTLLHVSSNNIVVVPHCSSDLNCTVFLNCTRHIKSLPHTKHILIQIYLNKAMCQIQNCSADAVQS